MSSESYAYTADMKKYYLTRNVLQNAFCEVVFSY